MFPVFMVRLSSYLVIKTAQAYIGGGEILDFTGGCELFGGLEYELSCAHQ